MSANTLKRQNVETLKRNTETCQAQLPKIAVREVVSIEKTKKPEQQLLWL
jgi:hypothetical protein